MEESKGKTKVVLVSMSCLSSLTALFRLCYQIYRVGGMSSRLV